MNNEVERAVHGESLEVCRDRSWNLQMSTNELIHIRKLMGVSLFLVQRG